PTLSARIKELKPKAPPKPMAPPPAVEAEQKIVKEEQHEIQQTVAAFKKKGQEPNPDAVAEWFVLKGENKYGPFSYPELINMLQQKLIFEFDFVWHSEMSNWQRVAELPSFKSEKVRALKETSMPEISDVFFRRRHRRVAYNG